MCCSTTRIDEAELHGLRWAITPEMAAAVAKLMSNKDLVARRRARSATSRAAATRWASAACSASASSPTTRPTTWAASCCRRVDGLLFGCGDAVIGVNPATESVDTVAAILHGLDRLIERLRRADAGLLPGPHHARSSRRCERGAPVDLLFQSVAGTEAANASFGITLGAARARAASAVLEHHRGRDVPGSATT